MPTDPTDSTGCRVESLDVIVQAVLRDLQVRGTEPELPTGLPVLDEAIWGLHRAELSIISARPGEGKTTLALQIARHLAEMHKRVLFVSLEMTRQQLCERLLVQITQADAWDLRVGRNIQGFLERLAPITSIFPQMNLRLVDGWGYTIEELRHLLTKVVQESGGPPDLLIIDFVQLIAIPQGFQRFDAIAEYLRAVKELAMRYRMAVIVCSQMNRDVSKNAGKRPALHNLKGSGALEELADCVLMAWWEELGSEERPEGTRYWLLVEKNRHGAPGQQIPLRFDPQHLTFSGVEEPVAKWQADGVPEVAV